MYRGRIQSIQRVIWHGKLKYALSLSPNYSFRTTGNQIQYCDTIADLLEMSQEIVYCDGTIIY